MPKKVECRYCGAICDLGESECSKCGANLSDGISHATCDRCGIPLKEGTDPVGNCVTCQTHVFLCEKHKKRVENDEVYCREHETECFIATAVFGTPLHPKIDLLRNFRDEWLNGHPIGRIAIRTYYEVSPPIARYARRSERLRMILQQLIVEPGLKLARAVLRRK
ncbi:MAG: CFI-box-CTERM domain-containing protein [Candidatus Thorarchaeota archaeon SMTZ1-45]|nr:MAG: hypothetical protein AM325_15090 [Candidatus Thorarchaeota archaeon SMTZ1-45]